MNVLARLLLKSKSKRYIVMYNMHTYIQVYGRKYNICMYII